MTDASLYAGALGIALLMPCLHYAGRAWYRVHLRRRMAAVRREARFGTRQWLAAQWAETLRNERLAQQRATVQALRDAEREARR